MVVNTNIAALSSWRQLSDSSGRLAKALGRLSSGSRITSPEDDAAGLSQSLKLSNQAIRTDAALQNAQNLLSFQQTQLGYLEKVRTALDRMAVLSLLSKDSTKTASDVSNYTKEFDQLNEYITNVTEKTFNAVELFGTSSMALTDAQGSTSSVAGSDLETAINNGAATKVIAWGNNQYGQTDVPDGLTDVKAVAAGSEFSMALKSDGTVVAWGALSPSTSTFNAEALDGETGVDGIAAGGEHGLLLRGDGTVDTIGFGGANAQPAGLTGVVAVAAEGNYDAALKSDGTVEVWGNFTSGPVSGLTNVTAITVGDNVGLALKNDGTVFTFGFDWFGSLQPPGGLSGVTAIAAGFKSAYAVKSDGTVAAWGISSGGNLDVPAGLTDVTSIAANGEHAVALREDGTLVAWGNWASAVNGDVASFVPSGLKNITAVATGPEHTLAIQGGLTIGDLDGLKEAIEQVATLSAKVAANVANSQRRLESLHVEKENLLASTSRISETDIAIEATNFAKSQLLVDMGSALLGQANAHAELVLRLLVA